MHLWQKEHCRILQSMMDGGSSYSQIAEFLSKETDTTITRCSVAGKINRLRANGWRFERRKSGRKKGTVPKKLTVRKKRKRKPVRRHFVDETPDMLLTYDEMLDNDSKLPFGIVSCRYIYGDPRSSDWGYCPNRSVEGSSYCEKHEEITHKWD